MMETMTLFRIAIIVICAGFAVALMIRPALFPGAPSGRVPVIIGLLLLAALNYLRFVRSRQAQRRQALMDQIPKKPLGL
jgi:hypothetical protein